MSGKKSEKKESELKILEKKIKLAHPEAKWAVNTKINNSTRSLAAITDEGIIIYALNDGCLEEKERYIWPEKSKAKVDFLFIRTIFYFGSDRIEFDSNGQEIKKFLEEQKSIEFEKVERKWYQKIIGFRSQTPWKTLLASIVYLSLLIALIDVLTPGDLSSTYFGIATLISLILFIIGLINPYKIKHKKRFSAGLIYGGLCLWCFMMISVASGDTDTHSDHSKTETAATHVEKHSSHKFNDNHSKDNNSDNNHSIKKASTDSVHKPKKSSVPKDLIPAVVSKNVDGDTIHVTINGKDEEIRMLLIDTPEDVHPSKPVEPYSREAAAYAEEKLPVGKHIYIKEGIEKRDKYNRLLAYVFITPNDMYNEDVVRQGLARVGYVYNDTTYLSKLDDAQDEAKAHKLNIWSIPNYVDEKNDRYNLKIACKWASEHGESTRGCPAQDNDSSHRDNHVTHHSISAKPSHSSTNIQSDGADTHNYSNHSSDSSGSDHQPGCDIKGSRNHIYHLPGDEYYDRTTHVVRWFCSEAEARQAGWRASKR
ncbi:endonuclease YncB(thermonuclease family) [Scopulibacillus daqui]|uniref:Endonuclease YncB(Thermonuclease family) n=1 Tax=Scopulibacillus daqui TaxID=1469162 RepID=A0ABS2PVI3_9BACL|nr:thermonuclease family protein [Scopulibacillus daqui]MBM7644068.1 endonuclease YncB(thermonuclease family) [Scopulibacillus daqui]